MNTQTLYFAKTVKVLASKNKLQLDVIKLVDSFLNRRLVTSDEINELFKRFKEELKALEVKYPRCKKLVVNFQNNTNGKDISVYNEDLFRVIFYNVKNS